MDGGGGRREVQIRGGPCPLGDLDGGGGGGGGGGGSVDLRGSKSARTPARTHILGLWNRKVRAKFVTKLEFMSLPPLEGAVPKQSWRMEKLSERVGSLILLLKVPPLQPIQSQARVHECKYQKLVCSDPSTPICEEDDTFFSSATDIYCKFVR